MAKGKYERWLEPDGLTLLEGWARDGLTDEQIAKNIGVSRSTLNEWKSKYSDISDALKKGKEVVDIQVENALLKRALGYDFQETRVEKSDKDGTKIIQTLKHIPADTTAQIFWLKNRQPGKWRDKPAAPETSGQDNNLIDTILGGTEEDVETGDIPEIEQAPDPGNDMVEPPGVP